MNPRNSLEWQSSYYCKELMSYVFYIYIGITFEQIMQHYLLTLTLCFTLAIFTISLHKL